MQRRIHKTEINKTWVLMIFAAVAFAMSLLPILISAFYAHPLYDDYWFSSGVYHQVTRGGSIIDILRAAADMVKDIYVTWQGSFSAVFLFSLQPGVFGQDYYFLTTFIMLGLLIGSHVFLFDTILVKWLKLRKEYEVLLTLFMLTMIIQFIPDIRQAFYWYNGSCYYTLFYSLSVILVGTMIRIELKRSRVSFRNTFPLSLLAFFIGGGNYSTALLTAEICIIYTLISQFEKKRICWWHVIISSCVIGGLLLSAVAPGNRVRASSVNGLKPLHAICSSLFYACVKIGEWTTLSQCVFVIFILPIMFEAAKRCEWSFRWPIAACFAAFCLFASQMTPTLYAQSDLGAGRQINIYYYAYYMMLVFIVFYVLGWMHKRYCGVIDFIELKKMIRTHIWSMLLIVMFVWGVGCFSYHITKMTSVQTLLAVLNGSVAQYDAEYDEIIEQIKNTRDGIAIKNVSTVPAFFGGLKLGENNEFFEERMADYFNVSYIDIE